MHVADIQVRGDQLPVAKNAIRSMNNQFVIHGRRDQITDAIQLEDDVIRDGHIGDQHFDLFPARGEIDGLEQNHLFAFCRLRDHEQLTVELEQEREREMTF
ncbi:hypothetical protein D3C76_1070180 [compost metagenome]